MGSFTTVWLQKLIKSLTLGSGLDLVWTKVEQRLAKPRATQLKRFHPGSEVLFLFLLSSICCKISTCMVHVKIHLFRLETKTSPGEKEKATRGRDDFRSFVSEQN